MKRSNYLPITLQILRADLVDTMQKAGTAWPGRVELRDGEVILTQME